MNRKIFYFSLLSVAIASCSTANNKQAVGDFEYVNKAEGKILKVPEGLDEPFEGDTYVVTNKINTQGPVGENVDVRAPSLVLPVALSSRVGNDSGQAKVWFDQVIDEQNLTHFIVDALKAQLNSDDVEIKQVDDKGLLFESAWYQRDKEGGFWFFKSITSSEKVRYRYLVESKSHGRSVALEVELIDYVKTDENGEHSKIDIIDQQRAEMSMLNEVISQVDYQYRLIQKENRLLIANKKFVSLSENSKGEAAYLVAIKQDLLWSNLPLFFEDNGFSISDLNETEQIYYLDYVKPEFSLWDKIWGDEVPVVELPNGKYQFRLESAKEQSVVTIYNDKGVALPASVLEEIFDVMEPGLSFQSVF